MQSGQNGGVFVPNIDPRVLLMVMVTVVVVVVVVVGAMADRLTRHSFRPQSRWWP